MIEKVLGYIKYIGVSIIPAIVWINWSEIAVTSIIAVLAGFSTAVGGFLARLLTNYLKREWPKLFQIKKKQ